MSATNEAAFQCLELIFENAAWAGVGDAGGLLPSAVAGSLYVSLHTSDPGETGTQVTNEVTTGQYGQYARIAVARSAAGWTAASADPATVTNDAAITWTVMSTGSGTTATHFGIGTDASGAGALLFSGALTDNLVIGNGVTPNFAIGALVITMD
jgi:hypothetical protein